MTEAAPLAVVESVLTVQVGGERFALPASGVTEVIRLPALTRVPLGPPSLLGLANLRGAVMPVVSLHNLLDCGGAQPGNARVVVIDRGAPVGLVIDKVAALNSGVEAISGATADDASQDSAPARRIDLDSLLAKDFGHFTRRLQYKLASVSQEVFEQTTAAPDEVALVCFTVTGQDYALPLTSVYEVVALPEGIAVVPQTDAVMLGMMTLRGQLLPLVSLQGLLGLRAGGQSGSKARVVVVRVGEGLIGLAIDGMKEILRISASAIDPVPTILTRGGAEAQIQGICRLDGGKRLVSVLSTDHLFRDQALLEEVGQHMGKNNEMEAGAGSLHDSEQFIIFQLGGDEYGLPIGSVDEVVRVPDTLTRLPKAPAFIEGVMNLRGRVVPVIDQRNRFKIEAQGERRRERIMVVRIGHMQAGFLVDAVSEVLNIPRDQLRTTPDLAADESGVIDRIANFEVEGRMILLLNPRELLDNAEKDLLASMDDGHPEPVSS